MRAMSSCSVPLRPVLRSAAYQLLIEIRVCKEINKVYWDLVRNSDGELDSSGVAFSFQYEFGSGLKYYRNFGSGENSCNSDFYSVTNRLINKP